MELKMENLLQAVQKRAVVLLVIAGVFVIYLVARMKKRNVKLFGR